MDRDKLIALLKKHHTAFSAMLNVYNHLPFNNSIKGKVKLSTGVTMLKKCRIVSGGTDNEIIIGDLSTLERCEIYIYGSHNTIRLGDRVSCTQACFCIEGDHNRIEIGYHTTLVGSEMCIRDRLPHHPVRGNSAGRHRGDKDHHRRGMHFFQQDRAAHGRFPYRPAQGYHGADQPFPVHRNRRPRLGGHQGHHAQGDSGAPGLRGGRRLPAVQGV